MIPVLFLIFLLLVPPGAPPAADETPVAITIDDLPWIGLAPGGREAATDRLLETLTSRGIVATGFVNCDRAEEEDPILERWLEAGMELGNHTAAHKDLNTADLGVWLDDVRRCDAYLEAMSARPTRWFRFPFLHQGPTLDRREAVADALDALGTENAHVTIDTSDWLLAVAYREALERGDQATAERVGRAYVEHIVTMARHYRELARARFGRDMSHVLLIHANALNADWLGAVLDALAADGFRFVPLEESMADPVYDLPDGYVGPYGLSWLYRVEPATPSAGDWDAEREEEIRQHFGVR